MLLSGPGDAGELAVGASADASTSGGYVLSDGHRDGRWHRAVCFEVRIRQSVVVVDPAKPIVRVVKYKWDGTVSAVDVAYPLAVPGHSSVWFVLAGSRRERPRLGAIEVVGSDELWVAVPGEWWVLCGRTDAASISGYKVHASAPFEAPRSEDEIVWVDLDLDFDVTGDVVEIQDETLFHDHARSMGYPETIVRGAWSGISTIAASYTNGDWPFDGSMETWVAGIAAHRPA